MRGYVGLHVAEAKLKAARAGYRLVVWDHDRIDRASRAELAFDSGRLSALAVNGIIICDPIIC